MPAHLPTQAANRLPPLPLRQRSYLLRLTLFATAILLLLFSLTPKAHAQSRDHFSVCWSIYAGWMPWGYAELEGIVDSWAQRYGITIDVQQVNDYVESINQYTAGNVDGCAMTNMDALTLPAASGVDSTALVIGDYSDGNDGVVLKGSDRLEDLAGKRINLVQFSVSHYLLARALDSIGMSERDVETVNAADADIAGLFSSAQTQAVVTWNPQLAAISTMPDANLVYSSKDIPGEILDLMVVNTQVLADNPDFGHALVGAWYEVMEKIAEDDVQALTSMAEAAGTDLDGYRAQLADTHLYTNPQDALEAFDDPKLLDTMERVARFSFDHGLLGEMAPNAEVVGIETPAGSFGDTANLKLRFDPSYVRAYLEARQ